MRRCVEPVTLPTCDRLDSLDCCAREDQSLTGWQRQIGAFDVAFKLKVLGRSPGRLVHMMATRIADEKENWASSSSRSAIARAGVSARGRGQSSHERWGRGGKRWKSGGQNKHRPRKGAALP